MKWIKILLIFSFFTCSCLSSSPIAPLEEAVVLTKRIKWREFSRMTNGDAYEIQLAPSNQIFPDYTEVLTFVFIRKNSTLDTSYTNIDSALAGIKKEADMKSPLKKPSFKVLEKNHSDALYTLITYNDSGILSNNEMGRIFVTEKGYHNISIFKTKPIAGQDERQWIDLFKNDLLLMSADEGSKVVDGVSLAIHRPTPFVLGSDFKNWNLFTAYSFRCYNLESYVPEDSDATDVREVLELEYMPRVPLSVKIDQVVEDKKKSLKAENKKQNIKFITLSQTSDEITFTYRTTMNNLKVTHIVRSFNQDTKSYSVTCKVALDRYLNPEELLLWKGRIEKISVKKM